MLASGLSGLPEQLELRWTDYRPHGQTILFELFGYFTLYFT